VASPSDGPGGRSESSGAVPGVLEKGAGTEGWLPLVADPEVEVRAQW